MIIAEAREKCKSLARRMPRDAVIVAVIILASSASFGLGFLAGRDAGQGSDRVITVGETGESSAATSSAAQLPTDSTGSPQAGRVVASKNGTKYYLPDCAGASRIPDANKVWFVSGAAAMKAGYEPAANCKGI
jgi:hypothetical protein